MNYLSVCSGIEAATCAWHDLGFNPVGFSEIEKFPSQLLNYHYPHVTNFGDMTKYKEWNINGTVELLVGGTPCQSFSVAGLRKGLDDPRGNLALTYVGILDKFRPKWFVWENVPGVLSSSGGRDFGSFLGAVAEFGYGFAYRVLDAQNFGVAQRRRRVFVVGHLGDWKPAAEVLFESESLSGDTKPSRKTGKEVAGYVESSFGQYRADNIGVLKASGGVLSGGSETFIASTVGTLDLECGGTKLSHQSCVSGHIFPTVYENHPSDSRVKPMGDVCQTVTSSWGTGGGNVPFVQNVAYEWHNQDSRIKPVTVAATLNWNAGGREGHLVQNVAYGFEPGIAKREGNLSRFSEEISPTLRADMGDNQVATAYALQGAGATSQNANGDGYKQGAMYTLNCTDVHGVAVDVYNHAVDGNVAATFNRNSGGTNTAGPKVMQNMAVRRLTPVECERLQGFPDNYTNIPKAADGNRYKSLGNSMAVPVMRWIGMRIQKVNNGL